jgi:hypothetical protein
MRMPRQHEIKLVLDPFRQQRIMQKQDVLRPALGASAAGAPRRQVAPAICIFPSAVIASESINHAPPVRAKDFAEVGKSSMAPIIVIARHAVERRFDSLQICRASAANFFLSIRSPVKQTASGESALILRTTDSR